LNGIRVKQDAVAATDPTDGRDGLEHPGLVVGGHHRNQNRVRTERPLHVVRRNNASRVHREDGEGKALSAGVPLEAV
jgi:hypothetical protein